MVNWVIVKTSFSGSESLPKSVPVNGVSSVVLNVSLTTIGASLTAVTAIVNVPESVPPFPSEIVYVNTGAVPE